MIQERINEIITTQAYADYRATRQALWLKRDTMSREEYVRLVCEASNKMKDAEYTAEEIAESEYIIEEKVIEEEVYNL